MAKESLDVLGEAREAEMEVNAGAKSPQERAPLFAIETRSFFGHTGEVLVGALPVVRVGAHSFSLPRRFWLPHSARSQPIIDHDVRRGLSKAKGELGASCEHRTAIAGEIAPDRRACPRHVSSAIVLVDYFLVRNESRACSTLKSRSLPFARSARESENASPAIFNDGRRRFGAALGSPTDRRRTHTARTASSQRRPTRGRRRTHTTPSAS
jgi:hypothetical protein